MHVALVEPEIPPNTGSIARLCAATETPLHLIGRLGFEIDDRHLRRAGLDYWPFVTVTRHATWEAFRDALPARRLAFSAQATTAYTAIRFADDDVLVFGGETRGLPTSIKDEMDGHVYRIPMTSPHVRSLNLANAVSIVLYEGLRQLHQ